MKESNKKGSFRSAQTFSIAPLAAYQQTLTQQMRLLTEIKTVLPEALAEHILHCVYQPTQIILYTDSASWASQLRFYQSPILDVAVSTLKKPTIKLKIKLLDSAVSINKTRTPILPSQQTVLILQNQANAMQSDALQQALAKLADTLNKRVNH